MCRSITVLRGLEPPATETEVVEAARQYVRKVSGVAKPSAETQAAFDAAVEQVAAATRTVLATLPPRRQPPTTVPPGRRRTVRPA
jgi:hypothetical protein